MSSCSVAGVSQQTRKFLRGCFCGFLTLSLLALMGCQQETAQPKFHAIDMTGAPYGSALSATDHTGKVRTLADFRGKVVTLFFGFTHCPDVCPTNLATMAQVLDRLGPDAQKVQVLFMTLDPERDTQALLSQYVPQFNSSFIGLRADLAQTQIIAQDFKVFFQKVPGSSAGDYSLDHSAGTYVFDKQGRIRLYVKHGETADNIVADLKQLLAAP